MLKENGRVVDIEHDALWVETIQSSTCSTCVAEKGCGQTLLKKIGSHNAYLRIPLEASPKKTYGINDNVVIAIPDDVIVKGSLLFYLLPLILLLVFSGVAHTYMDELVSIIFGLIGFCLGGFMIRLHSFYFRNDKHHQPFIVDEEYDQILQVKHEY